MEGEQQALMKRHGVGTIEEARQKEAAANKAITDACLANGAGAENDEVLEGLGEAGLQEVRQIRAALDRVAHGTFGECVNCGERIPEARLDLAPYAAVCVTCVGKVA